MASAKVAAALYQLAVGNWSNVKGAGPACSNGRLMLDQDIGFILARTVIAS